MEAKKKKAIILLVIGLILIVVILSVINNIDNGNVDENDENLAEKYVYNFGNTLDLENDRGFEEYAVNGTDYPSFGITNEYFDTENELYYYEDKVRMMTYDGYITISFSWMDEGVGQKVTEPDFGNLEKFILRNSSFSARYSEVGMKEMEEYINELAAKGFSNVELNNKNKKEDYYYRAAKEFKNSNDEEIRVTVILTYEQGMF